MGLLGMGKRWRFFQKGREDVSRWGRRDQGLEERKEEGKKKKGGREDMGGLKKMKTHQFWDS